MENCIVIIKKRKRKKGEPLFSEAQKVDIINEQKKEKDLLMKICQLKRNPVAFKRVEKIITAYLNKNFSLLKRFQTKIDDLIK